MGLKIYGPKKAFDSTISLAGALYVQRKNKQTFRKYNDFVFQKFFLRELDIESMQEMKKVLDYCGVPSEDFEKFLPAAKEKLAEIEMQAQDLGIFGTPTMVAQDGELFFGNEKFEMFSQKLKDSL